MFKGMVSSRRSRPSWCARAGHAVAPLALALTAAASGLALVSRAAHGAPTQFLDVRDPLWREIRTLELFPGPDFGDRIALPHLGSLPLELRELEGAPDPAGNPSPVTAISLARLERVL